MHCSCRGSISDLEPDVDLPRTKEVSDVGVPSNGSSPAAATPLERFTLATKVSSHCSGDQLFCKSRLCPMSPSNHHVFGLRRRRRGLYCCTSSVFYLGPGIREPGERARGTFLWLHQVLDRIESVTPRGVGTVGKQGLDVVTNFSGREERHRSSSE
jgi:hypothetical protein